MGQLVVMCRVLLPLPMRHWSWPSLLLLSSGGSSLFTHVTNAVKSRCSRCVQGWEGCGTQLRCASVGDGGCPISDAQK